MNLAVVSLIALLIAILVSCTLKVNVGFLSIVFAWVSCGVVCYVFFGLLS